MALLFGGVYSCERMIRSAAETTETVMDIPDVDGAEIHVTDTLVDAIAHYEYVSIYISRPRESLFTRLIHGKTLLFRYDPGSYDAPLPTITSFGSTQVEIEIPHVSSIFFQRKGWRGLTVDYQIGQIDYP